ncbi:MAG: PQQ-binding-like beta-propeller repeat protein [Acidobacteriota bacterium]
MLPSQPETHSPRSPRRRLPRRFAPAPLTRILPLLLAPVFAAAPILAEATADDSGWPQWSGPTGNWHAEDGEIAGAWPADGPRALWKRPLGEGYAGFAVQGDVAVTAFRAGDVEVAVALDIGTGDERWRVTWSSPAKDFSGRFGLGPYATPAIAGGLAVTVGSGAQVHAIDLRTGEVRWSRDLWRDTARPEKAGPGYTPSPLIVDAVGDRRIVLPLGHAKGRGVVALRLDDGSTAWSSGDDAGAHASVALGAFAGRRQLVAVSKAEVAGLDPATGQALWRQPYDNPNGANILTPVVGDAGIFLSSGPAKGSRLLVPAADADGTASDVPAWESAQLRIFYSNAVHFAGTLVGSNGGVGPATLVAVDLPTGKILWRSREVGRANLVAVGDRAVALEDDGTLVLLELLPKGPRVLARHQLFPGRAWTPPAIADGRLYARDRTHAVALDLRAPSAQAAVADH